MTSRRALLHGIAAAGGLPAAVAALSALGGAVTCAATAAPRLPPPGGNVVVIGAGIAGLTAAHELRRQGWRVRVLEAGDRPGGRCLTLRAGDSVQEIGGPPQRIGWDAAPHLYFNPGPARIPHHHRALLGYCREFGIALEPLVNENRAALLQQGDAVHPLRRVQADLRGVIAELAAKALDRGTLDAPFTSEDLEALRAMLRRFGALDRELRYRGTSRAGWAVPPGTQPGQPHPPLDPRLLLQPGFWEGASFAEGIDYAATMLQPVGGMDRIAQGFARALGGAITYGARVQRLRRTAHGARIDWQDRQGNARSTEAAHVIVTLPASVLANLDTDFSAERRTGLAALAYEPAAKLAWQAESRFWEDDQAIYGGISWTDRDITQLWYPSHGFHARKGILVGAYIWDGPPAERFMARSPAARAAAALAETESLHPGAARHLRQPVSVAWARMPHARGAWAEWTAEQRRDLMPLLSSPEGPYLFAGEHLSYLPGWQEGAIASAWAALGQLRPG